MQTMSKTASIILLAATIALVACTPASPTATSSQTVVPTPTLMPTKEQSPTPSPAETFIPTRTFTPRPTETAILEPSHTPVPPIATQKITVSPMPEQFFDVNSITFPLDLTQILSERPLGSIPLEFKITHRGVGDPCGAHPGDVLSPAGLSGSPPQAPSFFVYSPFEGDAYEVYPAGGGGLTAVLKLGEDPSGARYFLDIIHIDTFYPSLNSHVARGQRIGELKEWRKHDSYYEMQLHLALAKDYSAFDHPENYIDISPYLLPKILLVSKNSGAEILFTYEGPNYCNMDTSAKISALLDYLGRAGFAISGDTLVYQGTGELGGENFLWQQWDHRSIIIRPI